MPLFPSPSFCLEKAKTLCDKGLKKQALNKLVQALMNRKFTTWHPIHETIIKEYLELCVELRNIHIARDGLYVYKNKCPPARIQSLDGIVRGFLARAEEETKTAEEKADGVIWEFDDFEEVTYMENLKKLPCKDRLCAKCDSLNLTRWVNFLWQSYRLCLLLLLNNAHFEILYHYIVQKAFHLCYKYGRKTEFRLLCQNLKTHSDHILQHQDKQMSVNLNNLGSRELHLRTSYRQLFTALKIELYREAENAIEEIHLQNDAGVPNAYCEPYYYEEFRQTEVENSSSFL